MSARRIIINADDLGQSAGINAGIARAHDNGIVTSASLMVRWPAAAAAARWAATHSNLSVGIHLDLGEWAFRHERWDPIYEVVPLDNPATVEHQILEQLDRFEQLTGRRPTHVDSHQHVHMRPEIRPIVERIARSLAVPLRNCSRTVQYCGGFYGQTADGRPLPHLVAVPALVALLASLPEGVTELGCHPGLAVDEAITMYAHERELEVATLCDAAVRDTIGVQGIVLCTFAAFAGAP